MIKSSFATCTYTCLDNRVEGQLETLAVWFLGSWIHIVSLANFSNKEEKGILAQDCVLKPESLKKQSTF